MAKRIVLGVTGSIAAYKSAEIVRGLTRKDFKVRCILTQAAQNFVTPLTLSTLSKHPAATDWHDPQLWEMAHLSWASWADLVLIAPTTADFISKLASGRASELLDGLVLSTRAPVAICPAMDEEMWLHPATQNNVKTLRKFGYLIWGPEKGELASGKKGFGRLLDPTTIVDNCLKILKKQS